MEYPPVPRTPRFDPPMSLTGGIRPYDTFSYFELHCRAKRDTKLWMIMSHTCANCCGITYAAHFEHRERCPAGTGP
jgi:hypothetical protein